MSEKGHQYLASERPKAKLKGEQVLKETLRTSGGEV